MSLLPNPKKISELVYRIDPIPEFGMKVPVMIYANEPLLQKMILDKTIQQAVNVSTLPGVQKHVVVLPDGHQGYGFPVGGVAGMDVDEGVIVLEVLDMTLTVVSD
jgi:tRNA-splicing ligase RtcB